MTVLTLLSVAVAPPRAVAEPAADLTAALDAAVHHAFATSGIPGVIVGLSIPGTVDFVRAVGVSDTATGRPMSVDDHTRIGSVTKTFTGTAILQLVDQGRIRLDDPISRYVPGVPSGDVITLDMLGRMRSGLFDYTEDDAFTLRTTPELRQGPDAAPYTSQDLLAVAFAHPLNFAPNTKMEYCNTNFVLLGMVIEKVSGQPFGQYLQQNILGPLGLTETSYPTNGLMPEPFAHGYSQVPGSDTVEDATLWNPAVASTAGAMISTFRDLKAWMPAVAHGALLAPSTQANRLSEFGPDTSYSFAIDDVNGWVGHNGAIPGYVTIGGYLPQRDATLIVISNSDKDPAASARIAAAVTSVVSPDHIYPAEG